MEGRVRAVLLPDYVLACCPKGLPTPVKDTETMLDHNKLYKDICRKDTFTGLGLNVNVVKIKLGKKSLCSTSLFTTLRSCEACRTHIFWVNVALRGSRLAVNRAMSFDMTSGINCITMSIM